MTNSISDSVSRKFTEVLPVSDWEVLTDTGWEDITDIKQTVPYEKWELDLEKSILDCADTHIVFTEEYQEVFVRDLKAGDYVMTRIGPQVVIDVTNTNDEVTMYDLGVNSKNHRFYTNDILSHNTTTAAGYLLWYGMFVPDSTILIAAHIFSGAQEIMMRVRYGYETCPDHIRCGVVSYNKGSIEFDNGSRIVARATTETTGRGMSISMLYCLAGSTIVAVKDTQTQQESKISLMDLMHSYSDVALTAPQQYYAKNTKYQILGRNGWENFNGVIKNSNVRKQARTLHFADGNFIRATLEHRFFSAGHEVKTQELMVGMVLDTINQSSGTIVKIEECHLTDTYDIYNADSHVIVANNVLSHQCDEMGFLRPSIASAFWTSISPTLATGGKAIITSTPNSDEDQFATIWKQANKTTDEFGNLTELGVNGFRAYKADWWEHPDRDEEWARVERGKIGDERFRREFGLEFLIDDETLIKSDTLSLLEATEPIFKEGQVRWFKKPTKGNIYCVALDPSLGTGRDSAAIQVFEAETLEQVAEWKHNRTPVEQQIRILSEIVKYISDTVGDKNTVYYSIENNGIGEAAVVCVTEKGEDNIPGVFLSDPRAPRLPGVRLRRGFNTTNSSKVLACAKLKNLIETNKMKIKSRALISELKTFVASGNSYKAKPGESDDLVMALVLTIRMLQELQNYYKDIGEKIKGSGDDTVPPMPFIVG